jgi:hypothetical protein
MLGATLQGRAPSGNSDETLGLASGNLPPRFPLFSPLFREFSGAPRQGHASARPGLDKGGGQIATPLSVQTGGVPQMLNGVNTEAISA